MSDRRPGMDACRKGVTPLCSASSTSSGGSGDERRGAGLVATIGGLAPYIVIVALWVASIVVFHSAMAEWWRM